MKKNFTIFLLLFLYLFSFLYSKETEYGYRFQPNSITSNSSINFTPNQKKIKYENKFAFEFEFKLFAFDDYGHIFSFLFNDNIKERLSIYISDFYTDSSIGIYFSQNPSYLKLPKKIFGRNSSWKKIKLNFDFNKKQCEVFFNNELKTKIKFETANKGYFALFTHPFEKLADTTIHIETPYIAIRNVKIFNHENDLIHFWKFDEASGNVVKNYISNLDAKLFGKINWIKANHYKWEKFNEDSLFITWGGVTYDKKNNRLITVGRDKIIYKNLDSNLYLINDKFYNDKKEILLSEKLIDYYYLTDPIIYRKSLHRMERIAYYDNIKNELSLVFFYDRAYSKFDEREKKFLNIDTSLLGDSCKYYAALCFTSSVDSQFLFFGGYGWYTKKNSLMRYNFETSKIESVKTIGEIPSPRNNAYLFYDTKDTICYMLGGSGTGDNYFLYDYWKLNLKNFKFEKIGDLSYLQDSIDFSSHVVLDVHWIVVDGKNYGICQNKLTSKYKLFQINQNNTDIKFFAETVPIENDYLLYGFFYSEQNKEFILVTSKIDKNGFAKVKSYSLQYPPLEYIPLPQQSEWKKYAIYFFIGVAFIVVITFPVYVYRKRKSIPNTETKKASEVLLSTSMNGNSHHIKNNAIYFFGEFQMFCKNGKNITHIFTKQMLETMFMIVYKTFYDNGIYGEELDLEIWKSQYNSAIQKRRYSLIAKIRGVLKKYFDGVDIIHEDEKYKFQCTNGFYCDYLEYLNLISNFNDNKNISKEKLEKVLSFNNKPILRGFENTTIVLNARKIIANNLLTLGTKKYGFTIKGLEIQIADLLNMYLYKSEKMMIYLVQTYVKFGKTEIAKECYINYNKEYEITFGKKYDKTFQNILSVDLQNDLD